MKITVLPSLFLGCLLLMTIQGDSARVVPLGKEGNKNKLQVSNQKESFGGGDMMREEVMTSGKGGAESSKISGKESYDLKKKNFGSSPEQKKHHQKLMIKGPKEYLKSTKFVIPRNIDSTSTNSKCSQDCNAEQVGSPNSEEPHKDEAQRLVDDAAKEIANLIYKDYKGRPSHRPPINNHEPKN
ncbi:hypothetical protein RJT34_18462 [Clitoria ternatea]|uniref:Uncharacterized protein n=1 Tax=Clitoria ternatea TaxID=43366 RepID=A0AAN9JBK7_CLITE